MNSEHAEPLERLRERCEALDAAIAALSAQQPAAPTWIGIDWAEGQQPSVAGEMAELVGLLDEVRSHFTRDDDLPDDLLPRIDAALRWIAGGES